MISARGVICVPLKFIMCSDFGGRVGGDGHSPQTTMSKHDAHIHTHFFVTFVCGFTAESSRESTS